MGGTKTTVAMKICSKCKVLQPLENFSKRRNAYHEKCKSCIRIRNAEIRIKNINRIVDLNSTKICTNCKVILPLHNFHRAYSKPNGFQSKCKPCMALRQQKYYLINRDKINTRNKSWFKNNPEKTKIQRAKYHIKVKDDMIAYGKEYRRKNRIKIQARYNNDYSYKFDELTIEKWNANTNRYLGIYEHNDDKWEFKPN